MNHEMNRFQSWDERNDHPLFSPRSQLFACLSRRHKTLTLLNLIVLFIFLYHLPYLRTEGFFQESTSYVTSTRPSDPNFKDEPGTYAIPASELQTKLLFEASKINGTAFPKKIWQIWKTISLPDEDSYDDCDSWQRLNPSHEYELLTDKAALQYVTENFNASDPDIVYLYANLPQRILAADLLRYLVMFKSGGLYTDIDTHCELPIDQWLIEDIGASVISLSDVNIVIGIEVDLLDTAQYPNHWLKANGFIQRIQFTQWTIYAKPGHEILRRTITSIQNAVLEDISNMPDMSINSIQYNDKQVLGTTGPWMWTRVIKQYINDIENREVDLEEFGGMKTPTKFGDVLILPTNKWNPGGPKVDGARGEPFVHHNFAGMWKQND
ncbi:hypothetical protein ABW20_dc0105163 [Dactylellina cionopaga]|nr:hypothetical protein ABW20_dc0105163 [Dactylellina cionopaga]